MKQQFEVISPVDGSLYLKRAYHNESEMRKALEKAKDAEKLWRTTPLHERMRICTDAISYLVGHAGAIGEELTWQMGRPVRYTPSEITGGLFERASYMISMTPAALEDIKIGQKTGFTRFIRHQPLGTVLILAPWNYPYLTAVNALVPALLAGNCVLLKHATQTPLCAERFVQAFEAAGIPAGVLQFLHLDHSQVAQLAADNRINFVCFTGSVEGGHAICRATSKGFTSSGLELGGKDPAYVRQDADLEMAIENLVDGSFFNSGQSCCGVERIYVYHTVYDDFLDGFIHLTQKYVLDNPLHSGTTLGPVVRIAARTYIEAQLSEALSLGAIQHIDRSKFARDDGKSSYMAPQVLTHVNHSMAIMRQETFGPVVGIMPVKDDKEAIHYMNDSPYGLTASIWTKDLHLATALGNKLETGTVFMNRCDYLDPALAWTGVKDSGRGCTLSPLGFNALTRPQSFHLKHQ